MVLKVGVEPTRYYYPGILSPMRLPITPLEYFMERYNRIELSTFAWKAKVLPLN